MIRLAITDKSQIVNMNDVYKVYGKEKGEVNNLADTFFSKAIDLCDKYSSDDEIIKIGEVGTSLLFYDLKNELEDLKKGIKDYCTARREAYSEVFAQQEKNYDEYKKEQNDNQPGANVKL